MTAKAELKPWDGKDATGRYQHNIDYVKDWNMMIDEQGTVYYEINGKHEIWCSASKLTGHLRHLEQIKSRK